MRRRRRRNPLHQQCRRLGNLRRCRQDAKRRRRLAKSLIHGVVGRWRRREEQRPQGALLLEFVLDASEHVVDEDAALQARFTKGTLAVELHQGDVEDGLSLQGVGHLRKTLQSTAYPPSRHRRLQRFAFQALFILFQLSLRTFTEHISGKQKEERERGNINLAFMLEISSYLTDVNRSTLSVLANQSYY